jgi:hypothetical protein
MKSSILSMILLDYSEAGTNGQVTIRAISPRVYVWEVGYDTHI